MQFTHLELSFCLPGIFFAIKGVKNTAQKNFLKFNIKVLFNVKLNSQRISFVKSISAFLTKLFHFHSTTKTFCGSH
jgi:hypothetical protein